MERNTAFLPFKINAPDAAALVAPADAALVREVAAKGLTMVNRAEAERLVAYDGPWPPPAAAISRVADDISDPDHTRARQRAARLLALYREVEDLVQIGAYARGPYCITPPAMAKAICAW